MVTQYDKAYAAALTAIITYVVGQVWIDLPEGITAALIVLITPAVTWRVPNKRPKVRARKRVPHPPV
jgi:hypothetical protein